MLINKYSTDTEKRIVLAFKKLRFEESKHLYSIIKDKKFYYLPSVSSKVEAHAYKFNTEKMLPLSARKEGVEVEVLRQRWVDVNRIACELGTKTHDFLEHYTGIQLPSTPQEVAGIKYIKDLYPKYRISFRELRAYSNEFMYAGTMDLPLEVVGQGTFEIADYKTNGDLFKAYDYLKPPFQSMEASPFNKYQIQLSYYQIMLEEIGLKIVDRKLVHLRPDGEYRAYSLTDLTSHLRDHMKHQSKKLCLQ